jgi:deazaflavin-dependent oxidoreductase (nitroreductase family)
MAKTYRITPATRLVNGLSAGMIKAGVAASYAHILTVRGRKTGLLRSTPVDVITVGQDQWLVGAYGQVDWTRNARAAGEVTLRRGRQSQRYTVSEPDAHDAVPVLREYITRIRVARPYFDAVPDSPDDAIRAELTTHPVFRLTPKPAALRLAGVRRRPGRARSASPLGRAGQTHERIQSPAVHGDLQQLAITACAAAEVRDVVGVAVHHRYAAGGGQPAD